MSHSRGTNQGFRAYSRGFGTYPDTVPLYIVRDFYYGTLSQLRYVTQGSVDLPALNAAKDSSWHTLEVLKSGSNYVDRFDSLSSSGSDATSETGSLGAFVTEWNAYGSLYVDWVFLGKYVSPEPQNGGWGSETGYAAVTLWGTLWFDSTTGEEPEERNKSGNVSQWIYQQLFSAHSCYTYDQNYWGSPTTDVGVYGNISYCSQNFNYATFFYKGHTWNGTILGDGHNHYSFFSYSDTSPRIIDLYVSQNMTGGFNDRFCVSLDLYACK